MSTVEIYQQGRRYVAVCPFALKDVVKKAGFRWDPTNRHWYTTDPGKASIFHDEDAIEKIIAGMHAEAERKEASIASSRADDSDIDIPCPEGLAYLPYQRGGIAYALARTSVLIADEMGLGKTIQAIGIINADSTVKKVLITCPATLKLNWRNELRKFLVREMSIGIAEGKHCYPHAADITIINYDIAPRHQGLLRATKWDMIICDEMHLLKNPEAKRTIAIVGCEERKDKVGKPGRPAYPGIEARRKVGLTGTPIPNRVKESWPMVHYLDPVNFPKFFPFAIDFCGGVKGGYGWSFDGASNLDKYQAKLRSTIMIRRLKCDVLKELPAKRRSVIELEATDPRAIEAELEAYDREELHLLSLRAAVELAKASDSADDYAVAINALAGASRASFSAIAKLRHDTAVSKIPQVLEHLDGILENEGKVVVFAHHVDVLKAIHEHFGAASVLLYGDTAKPARQAAVDRFQSDHSCRVFVGGIIPAGVGITLTAASHVVFAELDWVPGNVSQAEDRCHRIGQKEMVLVDHLVLEDSLDARMAKILIGKQDVIDRALDRVAVVVEEQIPAAPDEKAAATSALTKERVEKEALQMTAERVAAIHVGLKMLAASDRDHAQELNGVGFNRLDTMIGCSLAASPRLSTKQAVLGAKLVNKYRKQLPPDVVERTKAA